MTAILTVRIIGDAKPAKAALSETDAALQQTETRADKFNSAMKKAALPAAALVAAVGKLATESFTAASALEQSTGAVEAVFGAQADAVKALAADAADSVGLATSEYQELASVLGSQLGNMGVAGDQIAGQTDDLIGLGADLAAQFGGSTSEAVSALSSLMRGERDPIEKYGVSISAAAVEAKKAELGLSDLTGEADKAATTQATLALLTEQTAAAQGAFARESDTAAGAQQRAEAAWQNASAALGSALLPVVAAAATHLAGLAEWVQQNSTVVGILVGVVAALAAGVLIYNGIMTALPAIHAAVTAAQWLWNAAMAANPIMLVVLAIIALIAIIVLLIQNWDTVKAVAGQVWDAIVGFVTGAASAIGAQADRIIQWFAGIPDRINTSFENGIQAALNWVTSLRDGVDRAIQSIFGWLADVPGRLASAFSFRMPSWVTSLSNLLFSAPAVVAAAGDPDAITASVQPLTLNLDTQPASYRTRPLLAGAASYVTEVNVNGGYIDRQTLDRLTRQLEDRDRRRGLTPANQRGGIR